MSKTKWGFSPDGLTADFPDPSSDNRLERAEIEHRSRALENFRSETINRIIHDDRRIVNFVADENWDRDRSHILNAFRDGYEAGTSFAASETTTLTARLEAVEKERDAEKKDHKLTVQVFRQQELIWKERFNDLEKENAELRERVHKADGMANEVNILVKENRELRAEVERLWEDVKKFRDSTESMVAAFDDRPEGEPEDITRDTRTAALVCAMDDLGWTEQAERKRKDADL